MNLNEIGGNAEVSSFYVFAFNTALAVGGGGVPPPPPTHTFRDFRDNSYIFGASNTKFVILYPASI